MGFPATPARLDVTQSVTALTMSTQLCAELSELLACEHAKCESLAASLDLARRQLTAEIAANESYKITLALAKQKLARVTQERDAAREHIERCQQAG